MSPPNLVTEEDSRAFAVALQNLLQFMRAVFPDDKGVEAMHSQLALFFAWGNTAANRLALVQTWLALADPCRQSIHAFDAAEFGARLRQVAGSVTDIDISPLVNLRMPEKLASAGVAEADKRTMWNFLVALDQLATGTFKDAPGKLQQGTAVETCTAAACGDHSLANVPPAPAPAPAPALGGLLNMLNTREKQTELAQALKLYAPQLLGLVDSLVSGNQETLKSSLKDTDNPLLKVLNDFMDTSKPEGLAALAVMEKAKANISGDKVSQALQGAEPTEAQMTQLAMSRMMAQFTQMQTTIDEQTKLVKTLAASKAAREEADADAFADELCREEDERRAKAPAKRSKKTGAKA